MTAPTIRTAKLPTKAKSTGNSRPKIKVSGDSIWRITGRLLCEIDWFLDDVRWDFRRNSYLAGIPLLNALTYPISNTSRYDLSTSFSTQILLDIIWKQIVHVNKKLPKNYLSSHIVKIISDFLTDSSSDINSIVTFTVLFDFEGYFTSVDAEKVKYFFTDSFKIISKIKWLYLNHFNLPRIGKSVFLQT